jgi:hypothetical protein
VALLYISRWKTPQMAERFARFYSGAVSQRYRNASVQAVPACSGTNCPVSMAQIVTEEGPVIVEHWKDNSVIVSEGFDPATRPSCARRCGMERAPCKLKSATGRDWIGCSRFRRFKFLRSRLGNRLPRG